MRSIPSSPVKPSAAAARRIWIRQHDDADNAWVAAANLLALMGVAVPPAVVKETIATHHEYPGLDAVMDGLEDFGVKSEAAQGEADDLPSIAYPALVQVNAGGPPRFAVLWSVDAEARRVTWLEPESGWHNDSWIAFGKQWTGVTLLAEAPVVQPTLSVEGSPWRGAFARALPIALPIVGFAYVVYAAAVHRITWFTVAMALLYALGLTMSVLSVLHGLGSGLKRLCPAGRTLNCRGVLESPASKLFGWLPMADLGVVYFLTGLVLTTMSGGALIDHASDIAFISALMALAAVPYALFAIGYQAFRLKQWCWMCLVVQSTVLVMAVSYLWPGRSIGSSELSVAGTGRIDVVSAVVAAGLAVFVASAAWLTLRPLIAARMANPGLVVQNERLQGDPAVVERELAIAPLAPPYLAPYDLQVGDPQAPFELVVVSNPLCRYCVTTHREIVQMLLPRTAHLRISFRFMVSELEDSARAAALPVLEYLMAGQTDRAVEALHAAFAESNRSTSAASGVTKPEAAALLQAQYEWTIAAGVEGTPTLFLQGRRLPDRVTVRSVLGYLRKARRDLLTAVPAS